ncbi:hypothetical protein Pth03_28700 [Planotetraspora thailandica]|uniref:Uncharacterized protein n=1 Tax=Planotetraspora thailandica TaxID=487172 RepID=A0A8J3V3T0_9ACTN|nr:hypothetical protein [Planotetraspora thailandica]GII54481.1 hypothetical protein Pth03_28700 [Planotetraspora thailandica]
MTAVIMGLVAVVLLVLMVVALGMRSMNRRESALSSERLKAMAENKGPKPRRPAEETFFESFPKGFDAFEDPSERAPKQRPGAGRPSSRPGSRQASRPAQRGGAGNDPDAGAKGGKQAAQARGRRGVDEWGESDDYDDDYWSRVRSDDGGFTGGPGARPAAPRPAGRPSDAAADDFPLAEPAGPSPRSVNPDAATVQAPLPQRSMGARQSDAAKPPRATPASAAAEQKTVAFSAPTPEALSAAGAAASADPLDNAPATGMFEVPPISDSFTPPARPSGQGSGRSGRAGRAGRSARRSAAASADNGAGRTSGSFETPRRGGRANTPYEAPAASADSYSGGFDAAPSPAPGSYAGDLFEAPPAPVAEPLPPVAQAPVTGSFETWAAYEAAQGPQAHDSGQAAQTPPAPQSDSYDRGRSYGLPDGTAGLVNTANTGPSYTVPPPLGKVVPIPTSPSEPSWSAPAEPPAPAAWSGTHDVLDDPEPPRTVTNWSNTDGYRPPPPQQSSYEGYPSYTTDTGSSYTPDPAYPSTPAPSSSSYEVSTGWATIDDAGSAIGVPTGPSRPVSPYESAGYDIPSGQSSYGHDQPQAQQDAGPQQNAGGSWPSYNELYGSTPSESTGARRGSHRQPDAETDYPDYYR